ncbi:MAG TPA: hypothetical protein VEJ18_16350, partial [Planctomycetota bacterium]|nr:hypothetical protein [Planctomycetota bacterium]
MKKEAWLAAVAGLLVAGTIATWFLSRPSPEGLATAARARALLDRASERVVFYTLHPRPRPVDGKTGNPDLHGWTVLQRK